MPPLYLLQRLEAADAAPSTSDGFPPLAPLPAVRRVPAPPPLCLPLRLCRLPLQPARRRVALISQHHSATDAAPPFAGLSPAVSATGAASPGHRLFISAPILASKIIWPPPSATDAASPLRHHSGAASPLAALYLLQRLKDKVRRVTAYLFQHSCLPLVSCASAASPLAALYPPLPSPPQASLRRRVALGRPYLVPSQHHPAPPTPPPPSSIIPTSRCPWPPSTFFNVSGIRFVGSPLTYFSIHAHLSGYLSPPPLAPSTPRCPFPRSTFSNVSRPGSLPPGSLPHRLAPHRLAPPCPVPACTEVFGTHVM